MVPSISLRWKVFGANSRACSKPHVTQPIVSKSLPYKGEPRFKGWEKVEKGRGVGTGHRSLRQDLRKKGASSLGEVPEEWGREEGPLLSYPSCGPCSYPYLTLAVGSLWLRSGDSLAPGAGSVRREEDSFDSDSTATLLKWVLLGILLACLLSWEAKYPIS